MSNSKVDDWFNDLFGGFNKIYNPWSGHIVSFK